MTTMEEAFTTQVAAYYDPKSKAFRVLGEARGKNVDEIIVAHELTHALDDQHFSLVHVGFEDQAEVGEDCWARPIRLSCWPPHAEAAAPPS